MGRNLPTFNKAVFHAPMLLDWTDEKLLLLDQDQLLNLLQNLDKQRASGRIGSEVAEPLEQRITALLTKRNATKRRKLTQAGDANARTPDIKSVASGN